MNLLIKMKIEKTALQFYKQIKERKELSKYKLVNGLFIVKYLNKDICVYVGDFLKSGSASNEGKTNKVLISQNQKPQQFYKKKLTKTGLGTWKKLDIGFREKPIGNILEWKLK